MPAPRPIPLSDSRLQKRHCLHLLKRLYVDPKEKRLKEPKGEPAMFGGFFHHIVAQYYETLFANLGRPKKTSVFNVDLMQETFEDMWDEGEANGDVIAFAASASDDWDNDNPDEEDDLDVDGPDEGDAIDEEE